MVWVSGTHGSVFAFVLTSVWIIVDQVAAFEETCLSVGYRRAFAISQSLSIAVNAILLKLNLVIEAQIPGGQNSLNALIN